MRWLDLLRPGRALDTPLAVGGRLTAASLLDAYRHGVFPEPCVRESTKESMHATHAESLASGEIVQLDEPTGEAEVWWMSPDPRGVYLPGGDWRPNRRLARTIRHCGWTSTMDVVLAKVMRACRRHETSWITDEMITAFLELHEAGHAHSAEIWDGEELVGGAYGVRVGAVLSIESIFHRRDNASKIAVIDLLTRFFGAGGRLADTQYVSEHLARTGAEHLPRESFLAELAAHGADDVKPPTERLPVDRLADQGSGGSSPQP